MGTTQNTRSGKMSRALSPPTKERTSKKSLKLSSPSKDIRLMRLDLKSGIPSERSWQIIFLSAGGYLMLSTSESPKDARESFLSQILETHVPEKYYLSPRACLGILRRAKTKGKDLPEILREALMKQAGLF